MQKESQTLRKTKEKHFNAKFVINFLLNILRSVRSQNYVELSKTFLGQICKKIFFKIIYLLLLSLCSLFFTLFNHSFSLFKQCFIISPFYNSFLSLFFILLSCRYIKCLKSQQVWIFWRVKEKRSFWNYIYY